MKFTIKIADAKTALEAATVVLNANSNVQEILKSYLIQADDKGVLIQGTDLEIAMIARQTSTVEEQGSVLVDGKKLSDIIRYASGEDLVFETADDKITIKSATGKSVLVTCPTDEYPKIDNFHEDEEFATVNRQQFIAALETVLFSVCEDETRRALNAVSIKDNQFVSTDGKMIAIYTSPVPFPIPETLIPQRSLAPLLRVLKKYNTETLSFQDTKAFYYFKIGADVFSIRKVNLQFPLPRLKTLIAKSKEGNTVKVGFNRTALIGAIERIRLNASPDSHAIYLGITNGKTIIKTQDGFGNYSTEELASTLDSEDVKKVDIFFNWLNLLDVLKAMSGDKVDCRFNVKYGKSPLYLGEANLDAVLLPIEQTFQQEALL